MADATAVLVPRISTNDDEAVIVKWAVRSGAPVAAGQLLAVLETTKTAFDVKAPAAGYIFFELPAKASVPVGAPIAWISNEPTAPVTASPAAAESASSPAPVAVSRCSRKALKLMREHSVAADEFAGMERIEVADVELRIASRGSRASAPDGARVPADVEPLEQSASKVLEAVMLERVYRGVVPSTVAVSVDERKLQASLRKLAALHGPVSLLEITIHAAATALAAYPELNGYYLNRRAFAYRHVAIGFAINAGRSLKVAVVRDAAARSPLDIARSVRDLTLRYMRDELRSEDQSGGTFTVTDLSAYGAVHFIPVLNDRQSAILGICAARSADGSRDLILSFDHRMADGMRAAAFLGEVRETLEAGMPER
jgi:pyruvate/2-oxoglutarate dehydrogenase complex dihydrolipoamide acyltransferase (E2) component